jgi:hypothetical protein
LVFPVVRLDDYVEQLNVIPSLSRIPPAKPLPKAESCDASIVDGCGSKAAERFARGLIPVRFAQGQSDGICMPTGF